MNDADQIEVHTTIITDGVVLRPVGEIDLSRAPSLRQQISQVQAGNYKRVVIDLSDVGYMDSSGVATLVEAMQVARRKGHKLILCKLQQRVRSIFEIARLDMVFTIVESTEQAASS